MRGMEGGEVYCVAQMWALCELTDDFNRAQTSNELDTIICKRSFSNSMYKES